MTTSPSCETLRESKTVTWAETTSRDAPPPIAGAVKYDEGKTPLFKGVIAYFPDSLELVADISKFGADKYAWEGWQHVDNGIGRYTEAMYRHGLAELRNPYDAESGYLHAGHVAWNALARLQLMIDQGYYPHARTEQVR
jgi:hypothetical protein